MPEIFRHSFIVKKCILSEFGISKIFFKTLFFNSSSLQLYRIYNDLNLHNYPAFDLFLTFFFQTLFVLIMDDKKISNFFKNVFALMFFNFNFNFETFIFFIFEILSPMLSEFSTLQAFRRVFRVFIFLMQRFFFVQPNISLFWLQEYLSLLFSRHALMSSNAYWTCLWNIHPKYLVHYNNRSYIQHCRHYLTHFISSKLRQTFPKIKVYF